MSISSSWERGACSLETARTEKGLDTGHGSCITPPPFAGAAVNVVCRRLAAYCCSKRAPQRGSATRSRR